MALQDSLLIALVQLIDVIPLPPPPKPHRGYPHVYSDRLCLKALVIMIVRRLATAGTRLRVSLLAILEQPTPEMQQVHALLTEHGRSPSRRTWELRLNAIPETLPAQIGCLGRYLVTRIQPFSKPPDDL